MTWTSDYLRLQFRMGGRGRPEVDCWGLYRLIVGERCGVWLDEFGGVEGKFEIARAMGTHSAAPGWLPVAAGQEREFDLVMMTGLAGSGRATMAVPMHVGCVVGEGMMLDIEEGSGVMLRPFRATGARAVAVGVANRVTGVFRAAALVQAVPTHRPLAGPPSHFVGGMAE